MEPIPTSLPDLHTYQTVVREGSFAAAARHLGVTRSAVSKAVRRVEQALGAQLLVRTTRHVRPTDAGRRFAERLSVGLDALTDARLAVEAVVHEAAGVVRLSAPTSLGMRCLVPWLPGFVERYPSVQLDLSFRDLVENLVVEELDLVLRVAFAGQLADSDLIAVRLGEGSMQLCASPDYLVRHGAPTRLNDLAHHRCVVFGQRLGRERKGRWWFEVNGQPSMVEVPAALRFDTGLGVREALHAGLGVGLVPNFLVQADLRSGQLVRLLPDRVTRSYGIYALRPPNPWVPVAVR
ncbi:MAG: LysR family transcriptional regulator, partial [Myxococcota bacterium]